jgi:hypothetical protein
MAWLDPAIHEYLHKCFISVPYWDNDVDPRVKPGHDDRMNGITALAGGLRGKAGTYEPIR